jgi:hypothetical protein
MMEYIYFSITESNITQVYERTDVIPQLTASNNRNVIVRGSYDVICLPGLHIAVSIVDPELASFGHFSHYLDSPYSVSVGMTGAKQLERALTVPLLVF